MRQGARPYLGLGRAAAVAAIAILAAASRAAAEEPAAAAVEEPVASLRREIEELRAQVRDLSDRLEALARAAGGPRPAAVSEPAAAPRLETLSAPPPPSGGASQGRAAGATAFNPAISAVFEAIGNASLDRGREDEGLSLSEAEIGLLAAVDPYARVDLFVAFGAEGEAEVEEGTATLQALPGGLQLKGGRFKSAFGKWNELHDHAFHSVDRPDALTRFFGDESLTGDGASLSWLVPGTGPVYLESITQVASTGNDVFFSGRRRDLVWLQRAAAVFPLTSNATLGTGLSVAAGKAGPSEALLEALGEVDPTLAPEPDDDLATRVFGADITYKWKPLGYGLYRSFVWQTEALASSRRAESLRGDLTLRRRTDHAWGGYTLAEYQFARRWRAGLRYDDTGFPEDEEARQRSLSALMRIQPTEFQEFRIQFKHTGRDRDAAALFEGIRDDNEIFVEWIPVIGAHAAHPY